MIIKVSKIPKTNTKHQAAASQAEPKPGPSPAQARPKPGRRPAKARPKPGAVRAPGLGAGPGPAAVWYFVFILDLLDIFVIC